MKWRERTLLLPLLVCLAALLLYPLAILFASSVRQSPLGAGPAGATLANFVAIGADPLLREALGHSLLLSGCVAAGATLLGLGPAWVLARCEVPSKRFLRAGFALPMSLSGIMVGFLTVIILGRVGFLPQMTRRLFGEAWLAGSAYQLSGLIVAYLYFEIPRAVLTLESALHQFDPRLDDAARSLGASAWQRFCGLTLPLIAPALLSTFGITFGVSLGSFGVALILSKRFGVLPLELFTQFTAFLNAPLASAMAVVLTLLALAVHLAARHGSDTIHAHRE